MIDCYECKGYGNDYYEDQNGNLICACDDCPFNPVRYREDYNDDYGED